MSEPAEQMRPIRRRRHSHAAVDLRGVPSQSGPLDDSGEIPRSTEPPDTNPLKLFGVPRAVSPARTRPAGQQAAPEPEANIWSVAHRPPFSFAPAAERPAPPDPVAAAGAPAEDTVFTTPDVPPFTDSHTEDDAAGDPFALAGPGLTQRSYAQQSSGSETGENPFVFAPSAQQETAPAPAKRSLFRRVDPSWRSVVAVSVVLGGLGGAAWGITHPPQYSGRADFVIDATVDLTGAPATALQQATDRDVATQAVLLGNQGVQATAVEALGTRAFTVSTRSDKDSNVISVSVTAPTYGETKRARGAYTKAYLKLVAKQQAKLLQPQIDVATQAVGFDKQSIAQLDADLNRASRGRQVTLIAQQTAQRASINGDLRENQQRLARLGAAQKSLPVNVHPLPEETPIEPSGLGALQWTALGLTLGAGTGAVISLRLAERRSLAARLL